jgi:hypothetical protein
MAGEVAITPDIIAAGAGEAACPRRPVAHWPALERAGLVPRGERFIEFSPESPRGIYWHGKADNDAPLGLLPTKEGNIGPGC